MNQLGDLLFSFPVLAGARRQWPDARLVSVVRPALAPLVTAAGVVDAVIERSGNDGGHALRLIAAVRREHAGTAVLFSESPASFLVAAGAGIPRRVGFATASLRFLLTETVARTGVPSLENNRRLGAALGIAPVPADYAGLVTVPADMRAAAGSWMDARGIKDGQVVLLSPGASKRRREKRWDPARWTALAARLTGAGLYPVFIGAPAEQSGLEALARGSAAPVFCSQQGILSLAALMARARACVGIDSGAMHLAAGVGTPVVALFGPTDPAQVGPRPPERHRVVCRQTMDAVTVEDVWAALHDIRVF